MTAAAPQPSQGEPTTRIGQAVMLHHAGDREEARSRFAALWEETSAADAFHRCTIAHYMADTQDDPADELAWDLRALAAADSLTEDHAARGEHAVAVRALYPSLHLNLAADHVKLGDPGAARRELDRARHAAHVLPDDAYGRGVLAAIDRLGRRLEEPDQRP
ncbi:tetratricopeptide repeat protein [Streptomyces sp. RKND-216]|uniref:tetratricopeptide repeat protein n=1 Tax=Streptomyces sp. RKND-216 TaxID=2562581 RepID=UPI00109DE6DD|nr:tetratricopeptide repeat protein [Streptomyces sp. RKND-216]THA23431.1 tetratricopeptide repeat protein [Streptomyces sp. RKND-216]